MSGMKLDGPPKERPWIGAQKRAAVMLGGHPNSATQMFKSQAGVARLMVSNFALFATIFLRFLHGAPLDWSIWPEAREIAGYAHCSQEQFEASILPAFQKLRRIWDEDDRTALGVLLPFLQDAMAGTSAAVRE